MIDSCDWIEIIGKGKGNAQKHHSTISNHKYINQNQQKEANPTSCAKCPLNSPGYFQLETPLIRHKTSATARGI